MKILKRWSTVPILIVGGITLFNSLTNSNADQISQSTALEAVAVEAQIPTSEVWTVKEGSVYDGDTLRVVRGNEELKIRFCGIDAPEKEQPLGLESRNHLRSLISQGDGTVYLIPIETDRYERTVAELFVPLADGSEIHLNSQMVMDGMAYHYERYSDSCPNRGAIVEAEIMAQQAGVGVWADPNRQYPWNYRQN